MRTAACPHLVCLLLICHFGSTLAKNGAVRADGSARLSFDAPLVVLGGVRTLVEFSLLAAGFPENTSLRVEVLGTHIAMDNAAPAASGILDVVVDSSGFLEMTGQVQLYSDPSLSEFDRFDLALLFRAGANGTILAITPPHPVRVIPAPLCILPALLVVIMAVVSRNVIMALLAGLALGGIFISPGSIHLRPIRRPPLTSTTQLQAQTHAPSVRNALRRALLPADSTARAGSLRPKPPTPNVISTLNPHS